MKKTINLLGAALLLCVFIFSSCSFGKKGTAYIYDGETQWENWSYNFMTGSTPEGDLALWGISFETTIGNSYRTISFMHMGSEPGTYTGTFDRASDKWSGDAVSHLYLTVDYDDQLYPKWLGQSAIVTIHNYDKKTRAMSATIEAVVCKEGTNETRNIKIVMDNLHLVSK